MGIGRTPIGLLDRAGVDFAPSVAGSTATLPSALQFDPGLRQFVQNADGTMASVHPVDQKVVLLLGIEMASIGSAASFGNQLRKLLARIAPNRIASTATQEVQRVLQPLVSAGDILLLSVLVDTSVKQRVGISVSYVNTRLANYNAANPKATANAVPVP